MNPDAMETVHCRWTTYMEIRITGPYIVTGYTTIFRAIGSGAAGEVMASPLLTPGATFSLTNNVLWQWKSSTSYLAMMQVCLFYNPVFNRSQSAYLFHNQEFEPHPLHSCWPHSLAALVEKCLLRARIINLMSEMHAHCTQRVQIPPVPFPFYWRKSFHSSIVIVIVFVSTLEIRIKSRKSVQDNVELSVWVGQMCFQMFL